MTNGVGGKFPVIGNLVGEKNCGKLFFKGRVGIWICGRIRKFFEKTESGKAKSGK
jgi:hypothetical protein